MKNARLKFLIPTILLSLFSCAGNELGGGAFARRKDDGVSGVAPLVIKNAFFDTLGDCTLAKIGDIDILIDCGGESSACNATITELLKDVKDNVLEYVIITHQDEDHLKGFSKPNSALPSCPTRYSAPASAAIRLSPDASMKILP